MYALEVKLIDDSDLCVDTVHLEYRRLDSQQPADVAHDHVALGTWSRRLAAVNRI